MLYEREPVDEGRTLILQNGDRVSRSPLVEDGKLLFFKDPVNFSGVYKGINSRDIKILVIGIVVIIASSVSGYFLPNLSDFLADIRYMGDLGVDVMDLLLIFLIFFSIGLINFMVNKIEVDKDLFYFDIKDKVLWRGSKDRSRELIFNSFKDIKGIRLEVVYQKELVPDAKPGNETELLIHGVHFLYEFTKNSKIKLEEESNENIREVFYLVLVTKNGEEHKLTATLDKKQALKAGERLANEIEVEFWDSKTNFESDDPDKISYSQKVGHPDIFSKFLQASFYRIEEYQNSMVLSGRVPKVVDSVSLVLILLSVFGYLVFTYFVFNQETSVDKQGRDFVLVSSLILFSVTMIFSVFIHLRAVRMGSVVFDKIKGSFYKEDIWMSPVISHKLRSNISDIKSIKLEGNSLLIEYIDRSKQEFLSHRNKYKLEIDGEKISDFLGVEFKNGNIR